MFQLRWIWKNMAGYRGSYMFALCLVVVGACMNLVNPIITQQIADQIIAGVPDASGQVVRHMELLVPLVLSLILATLVRTGIFYLMIILCERTSQGVVRTLRDYLYQNMQRQDMDFYDKNRTGDLMNRLTGDMDMIRHTLAWIVRVIIENVVVFAATVIYFLSVNVMFTLVLLALTPFIYIVTTRFSRRVGPLHRDARERLSDLNTGAQENIAGNRVVRAFAQEDFEREKFDEKNSNYRDAGMKANLMWYHYYPVIESLAQSLTVVTLLLGGLLLIWGQLTVGELIAFSTMAGTLANPMRMMGMLLNDLQRFFASSSKIIELYYTQPTIVDRYNAVHKSERFEGKVEFKDVSLKFRGAPVLKHITFTAQPGQTIAIMGNTGSGKTSMVNLIARLYDATEGEICVDGLNVKQWNKSDLRKNIGMATQEVFLFSDTVDGNIAYGDSSLSEEEVRRYAHLAAADFIDKMEEGFDTIIGERGVGLSGGQKQRIALARALAVRPAILILDDTTSAVDLETEKFIQKSLRELDFPCTKFIIAQRISTTKYADQILVFQDGEIVESGTHEQLIAQEGFYREIYELQSDSASSAVAERKGEITDGQK